MQSHLPASPDCPLGPWAPKWHWQWIITHSVQFQIYLPGLPVSPVSPCLPGDPSYPGGP